MKVTTRSLMSGGRLALVSAIALLAPLSAHAASVTFDGVLPSGTDPLGGTYSAGPTGGGLVQFEETAGIQPDPTQQVLFTPGSGLANANSFTLTITSGNDGILPLDRDFGNFFETFNADSTIRSVWDASVNAAGTAITYTAEAGDELVAGQRFGTVTTFSTFNDLPAGFTYSITWTGDALSSAVPEPASWAMMIGGVGFAGGMMRRRRATASKIAFA